MTTTLRSWFFTHRVEPDVVVVVDCWAAPAPDEVSVTNDIENVVSYLHASGRLGPGDLLVYKDTMERWDGVWHRGGKFVGFELLCGASSHHAIQAMRQLKSLDRGT